MTATNGVLTVEHTSTASTDPTSALFNLSHLTAADLAAVQLPEPDLAQLQVTTLPNGQFSIGGVAYQSVWQTGALDHFSTFGRRWGDVTDQGDHLRLTSGADGITDAGAMVPPTGADAGHGYGMTTFAITTAPGDVPGPYALLWPGTDQWPGPELDVMEVLRSSEVYSTVHYNDHGANGFASTILNGISAQDPHFYAIDWEGPGNSLGVDAYIDIYIDGQRLAHITDHVPADFAHGGENLAAGVGMQTWWSADVQHGVNEVNLWGASYLAPVGSKAAADAIAASQFTALDLPTIDANGNVVDTAGTIVAQGADMSTVPGFGTADWLTLSTLSPLDLSPLG